MAEKEAMLSTIRQNMRLNSIDNKNRGSLNDEDFSQSCLNLLAKYPKMSNLMNLVNNSVSKVDMYRMKLKLANIEIADLKKANKLIQNSNIDQNEGP